MTREEATQCIKHELLINVNRKDLTGQAIGEALDMAIDALRTGTWRWVDFWNKDRTRTKHGIQCSECGECYEWDDPCVLPSYCPDCGAKMEGGAENDRP